MLRASERGSTAVAVALSSPRTMMMMRCQSSKSNSSDSLPRPRQRRRRPSDVSARATPPPVVRGAGGGGGGGGSDEEGRAEQQRRHSWAPPGAPPSRRSDGESLQARVAADVLGVVHPARRNLTFSKALDVSFCLFSPSSVGFFERESEGRERRRENSHLFCRCVPSLKKKKTKKNF